MHRKARVQLGTGSTLCKVAGATFRSGVSFGSTSTDSDCPRRYPTTTPISETQESFCIAMGFAKRPPLLARRVGRRVGNVTQPTSAFIRFDVAVGSNSEVSLKSGRHRATPACPRKVPVTEVANLIRSLDRRRRSASALLDRDGKTADQPCDRLQVPRVLVFEEGGEPLNTKALRYRLECQPLKSFVDEPWEPSC